MAAFLILYITVGSLFRLAPIFKVSCVTGQNMDLLRSFFFQVPSVRTSHLQDEQEKKPVEFQVDEVFRIPGVSPVAAGTLIAGKLSEGDRVYVGPNCLGQFVCGLVESIHRNRSPCPAVHAGQTASIAIKLDSDFTLRKGHVLLGNSEELSCCREFSADIFLLFLATKISNGFQVTVHIGNVVQTAKILHIDQEKLQTGQRARMRFQFLNIPERTRVGNRILIHAGRTKGIGEITEVVESVGKCIPISTSLS